MLFGENCWLCKKVQAVYTAVLPYASQPVSVRLLVRTRRNFIDYPAGAVLSVPRSLAEEWAAEGRALMTSS